MHSDVHNFVDVNVENMMQDAEKEWKSLQNRGISCCSCDYSLPIKQCLFFDLSVFLRGQTEDVNPKSPDSSFPFSPGTHTRRFPTLGATWCCPNIPTYLAPPDQSAHLSEILSCFLSSFTVFLFMCYFRDLSVLQ